MLSIHDTPWTDHHSLKTLWKDALYKQYYTSAAQPATKIIDSFDPNGITEVGIWISESCLISYIIYIIYHIYCISYIMSPEWNCEGGGGESLGGSWNTFTSGFWKNLWIELTNIQHKFNYRSARISWRKVRILHKQILKCWNFLIVCSWYGWLFSSTNIY